MRLSGFIEEIYTVAFGLTKPCSLKVISKGLEETIMKTEAVGLLAYWHQGNILRCGFDLMFYPLGSASSILLYQFRTINQIKFFINTLCFHFTFNRFTLTAQSAEWEFTAFINLPLDVINRKYSLSCCFTVIRSIVASTVTSSKYCSTLIHWSHLHVVLINFNTIILVIITQYDDPSCIAANLCSSLVTHTWRCLVKLRL